MSTRSDVLAYVHEQLLGRGRYVMLSRDEARVLMKPDAGMRRPAWQTLVYFSGGGASPISSNMWPPETFRECACGMKVSPRIVRRERTPFIFSEG